MMFSCIPVLLQDKNSLNEVVELLSNNRIRRETVQKEDWPIDELLIKEWQSPSGNNIEVKTIRVNEQDFQYIFVRAYVERAKRIIKDGRNELLERDKRINLTKSDVIFFESNNKIYMILYLNLVKNNLKLNTIIKDLLVEDIWGTLTELPPNFNVTDDQYYWMLYKIMSNLNQITEQPSMELKTFTGFNGTINETNGDHSVNGEGERISALLSTLAFIFGDDSLKSLKLEVCINDNDSYLFELGRKGNVVLYENNYNGNHQLNNLIELQAKQTLVIYKVIIPAIFAAFQSDEDGEDWNPEIKKLFLRGVGQQIIERVNISLGEDANLENTIA